MVRAGAADLASRELPCCKQFVFSFFDDDARRAESNLRFLPDTKKREKQKLLLDFGALAWFKRVPPISLRESFRATSNSFSLSLTMTHVARNRIFGSFPTPKRGRSKSFSLFLVPLIGIEPIRYRYHWILSPTRLPVPPQRQERCHYRIKSKKMQLFLHPQKKIFYSLAKERFLCYNT